MKKNVFFICMILTLVIGISCVTASIAGATGFEDTSAVTSEVVSEYVPSDVYSEVTSEDYTSSEEGYTSSEYSDSSSYDGESSYSSDVYSSTTESESYDYTSSYTSYYYEDVEDYYVEDTPENLASEISDDNLYQPNLNDDRDFEEEEWDKIVLNVDSNKNGGGGSFSKIKNNNTKGDNGQWLLYVGFSLIGLSVIGIIYFIAATVSDKKKNDKNNRRGGGSNGRSSSKRYASEPSRRSSRAKSDTAEIYLPRKGSQRYLGNHMR